jgi:tRNA(Ile)-lysidine synthase
MHSLGERVLSHIRRQELLRAGDRVGVAVSGGIDSVALLRLLLDLRGELGVVLSVVHFNHKLRGAESDGDEEFVAGLARQHDLEFFCDSDDVAEHAAEERLSVEAAARELRYGFFRYLIEEGRDSDGSDVHVKIPTPSTSSGQALSQRTREGWSNSASRLNKIATGHTVDDQAETVLMRMMRGAGTRGMGGIYPRIAVENDEGDVCGEIVRPLLAIRRRELEQYLRDIGQSWREDASNADESFTRNRVRKLLVPLLEKEFNPSVAENLVELAEIARGEEDYWENEVSGWMGTAVHWSEPEWARRASADLVQIELRSHRDISDAAQGMPTSRKTGEKRGTPVSTHQQGVEPPGLVMNASVDRLWFLGEPVAVQRRVVKAIGEQSGIPLEFKHVEEILQFAAQDGPSGKELSLPRGWQVVREPEQLVFVTPDLREPNLREPRQQCDYEYDLQMQGTVLVREIGVEFEAQRILGDAALKHDTDLPLDILLDPASLVFPLNLRNWRAGDRFWPAHTKSSRKIKELLQERHVPQAERKLWPVAVSGEEIVWVRGFPVPAKFRAKTGREALQILERPHS